MVRSGSAGNCGNWVTTQTGACILWAYSRMIIIYFDAFPYSAYKVIVNSLNDFKCKQRFQSKDFKPVLRSRHFFGWLRLQVAKVPEPSPAPTYLGRLQLQGKKVGSRRLRLRNTALNRTFIVICIRFKFILPDYGLLLAGGGRKHALQRQCTPFPASLRPKPEARDVDLYYFLY